VDNENAKGGTLTQRGNSHSKELKGPYKFAKAATEPTNKEPLLRGKPFRKLVNPVVEDTLGFWVFSNNFAGKEKTPSNKQ